MPWMAAESWLVENDLNDPPCRFDVVEVYTNPLRIIHLPGAF